MLMPGDSVFDPELEPKQQACATEATHRFTLKGISALLRLQLFDGHIPRAEQAFMFTYRGGSADNPDNRSIRRTRKVPFRPLVRDSLGARRGAGGPRLRIWARMRSISFSIIHQLSQTLNQAS
jgi:hypothetical protein